MRLFFVKDVRKKYRCFSSHPIRQVQVSFSKWKRLWEKARQKLMLLPQRTLAQEQAFSLAGKEGKEPVEILHSGRLDEDKIKSRFFFYLQRQRTKHLLLLLGEALCLPISGLAALLPGPNVFFGVLALLMITHYQALRGIHRLLKKSWVFRTSPVLAEWEEALEAGNPQEALRILARIEEEHGVANARKILWK
ncbi:MAG: hypothetical protein ACE5LV_03080 [Candidatus Aminicenantales bacterium]